MTKKYTLPVGSVSHETLQTSDLLTACAGILEDIVAQDAVEPPRDFQSVTQLHAECRHYAQMCAPHTGVVEAEEAADTLSAAIDLVEEYCPPYCYFGMHEGDGSDLGCWIDHTALSEALRYGLVVSVKSKADLDSLPDHVGHGMIEDERTGSIQLFRAERTWALEVEI